MVNGNHLAGPSRVEAFYDAKVSRKKSSRRYMPLLRSHHGITVVNIKAGDDVPYREALTDLALGNVVHLQAVAGTKTSQVRI